MNKRHYEHTLPNIRGSLSNTYGHPAKEQHFFSFFLNTCQRSTEYLSRAKGKKYRTSEASTGDFLPGE